MIRTPPKGKASRLRRSGTNYSVKKPNARIPKSKKVSKAAKSSEHKEGDLKDDLPNFQPITEPTEIPHSSGRSQKPLKSTEFQHSSGKVQQTNVKGYQKKDPSLSQESTDPSADEENPEVNLKDDFDERATASGKSRRARPGKASRGRGRKENNQKENPLATASAKNAKASSNVRQKHNVTRELSQIMHQSKEAEKKKKKQKRRRSNREKRKRKRTKRRSSQSVGAEMANDDENTSKSAQSKDSPFTPFARRNRAKGKGGGVTRRWNPLFSSANESKDELKAEVEEGDSSKTPQMNTSTLADQEREKKQSQENAADEQNQNGGDKPKSDDTDQERDRDGDAGDGGRHSDGHDGGDQHGQGAGDGGDESDDGSSDPADADDDGADDGDDEEDDDDSDDDEDSADDGQSQGDQAAALQALHRRLTEMADKLHRLESVQPPDLDAFAKKITDRGQRALSASLEAQESEFVSQLTQLADVHNDNMGRFRFEQKAASKERDAIKAQKIFNGCDYAQSQELTHVATRNRSVYYVLSDAERRKRRDKDFETDKREFQKELLRYDAKIDVSEDLVAWFSRFDDWADKYEIPLKHRFIKITTNLLNQSQSDRLLHHNDGVGEDERIITYPALKRWLYKQYKSKRAISAAQTKLTTWARPSSTTLSEAYRSFTSRVFRYCHEIRFAMDYGSPEILKQIDRPSERSLFTTFLNRLGSVNERQRVWEMFSDIGGEMRLDILSPICARIDEAIRPGLGIDDFVRQSHTAHLVESANSELFVCEQDEILALGGVRKKKYCRKHGECLHSTSECRVLKKERESVMIMGKAPAPYQTTPRPTSTSTRSSRDRGPHCELCFKKLNKKKYHAPDQCWSLHPEQYEAWKAKWRQHRKDGGNRTQFMVIQQRVVHDQEAEAKEFEELQEMNDEIHEAMMIGGPKTAPTTEKVEQDQDEEIEDESALFRYGAPPHF